MQKLISILCVSSNSVYSSIENVELYDAKRDCRTFNGSTPIVAHPPCRAWSAFCAHQAKPALGERELAPFCVEQLRKCGGVLEHPAHSRLWDEYDLPRPGGGQVAGLWSMHVEQSWFGDMRGKQTWLLVSGVAPQEIQAPLRLHDPRGDVKRWGKMSKRQRAATPIAMAEWLVEIARKVG